MTKNITLRQVRYRLENSWFNSIYTDFIAKEKIELGENDKQNLLRIAVVFINYGDNYLEKLGYRIILQYSINYHDYIPLYDYSINKGYTPVSKFIEQRLLDFSGKEDSFFTSYFEAFQEFFRDNNIYLSFGQKELKNFAEKTKQSYVLVAPTSYGKSDLIINEAYTDSNKSTCIVVPTKALLAQTKKRIVHHKAYQDTFQRVITHPDMYKGNEANLLAVLTQERLLRILQKNPEFQLDLLLIDEAHNLFNNDERALLLSQVIFILIKRNPQIVLKFFTPFVSNGNNLESPYSSYKLIQKRTDESIKIEKYFICDLSQDKKEYLYDQFFNSFIEISSKEYIDQYSIIIAKMASKNIVYVNRPKHIEIVALKLESALKQVINSIELQEAFTAISNYVHPEYNLLKCLKSGIAYHHGGMPDIVRLYVETIYSKIEEINFIVTSSTLLEGVNIPAQKIFLLSTQIGRGSFSKSQFKNLIGRICRFNEIFSEKGTLKMLQPEIVLIKGEFERKNANLEKFLKDRAKIDTIIQDRVENVFLTNSDELDKKKLKALNEAIEYLENIEPQTIPKEDVHYVSSEIAQLCYKNNVYDFNIKEQENTLIANLENFLQNQGVINSPNNLLKAIYQIFIKNNEITDPNLSRLSNDSAQRFYSMFIEWRSTGSAYNKMINQFIRYWSDLTDPIIFVGNRWGEMNIDDSKHQNLYLNLTEKNESQRINLAIVRIKEEQDFVDNSLMKYVEILHDLVLLNQSFYDMVKYGTNDQRIIALLKNGFSLDLARLVIGGKYADLIQIDLENDEIQIDESIVARMEENEENKIMIFEIKYHVN